MSDLTDMKLTNAELNGRTRFLAKIRSGNAAYGCCITSCDAAMTEIACAAGMDFVWIDGERGKMDRLTAMHLLNRLTDCETP